MAGNIIGIVAQRLVRRLCPATARRLIRQKRMKPGCSAAGNRRDRSSSALGCERCDFQGYRGRLAIMEILRMNADLDELVARRCTAREIRQLAESQGSVSLADDGSAARWMARPSLAELRRVVDLTDRMGAGRCRFHNYYRAIDAGGRKLSGWCSDRIRIRCRSRNAAQTHEIDLIDGSPSATTLFGSGAIPRREIIHFASTSKCWSRRRTDLEGLTDLRDTLENRAFAKSLPA